MATRKAKAMWRPLPVPVGETCPQCGSGLVVRHGLFGWYIGCATYPRCGYIANGTFRPVRLKRRG
jgi:DNA topoisomerase-1